MLSAIRRSDNKKVLAREEVKNNQPFFCPECNNDTILKKGRIKVHHFAHKPPVTCEYGLGETEQHRRCKMEIYDGLVCHSRFANCEIERGMGTVRPDIYACMDGIQIAIEVQLSTLTLENIIYRTSEYAKRGSTFFGYQSIPTLLKMISTAQGSGKGGFMPHPLAESITG
jgi:competence protein CoiA